MATKNLTVCDVYGTTRDVTSYAIRLVVLGGEQDAECVDEAKADLCPRAYGRLLRFIERGVSPPPPRKAKEDA